MKDDVKVEVEGKSIEELVELLLKLKESGLLDTLKAMLERYEDLMTLLAQDTRMFHAMAVMEGALNGLEEADPGKLKWATMGMVNCLTKGMEEVYDGKVEKVGLVGLLKALREPEVMYGLGMLLTMARAMGKCMMEMEEKRKGK